MSFNEKQKDAKMKLKEAMQVFTNRNMAITALLAFSSGLPLPLVSGTLDVWMRSEAVDLTVIGMFSLVQLPYSLKLFWAPLMDHFRLPLLHKRAGWMVITQVGLCFAIFYLGSLKLGFSVVYVVGAGHLNSLKYSNCSLNT